MLPALKAVQAAKAQGWHASEQLDRALRRAFWAQGRCIAMRHVILDIAREIGVVHTDTLAAALDRGHHRAAVMQQYYAARDGRVTCSPHIFLNDGTNSANPGISVRWLGGEFGVGYPVVDDDQPTIYADLLTRAGQILDSR